jgi:hypothetical protein
MVMNLFQRRAVEALDLVAQFFAQAQAPVGPPGLLERVSQKLGRKKTQVAGPRDPSPVLN